MKVQLLTFLLFIFVILIEYSNSEINSSQSDHTTQSDSFKSREIRDFKKISCGADKNSPSISLRRNPKAKSLIFFNDTNFEVPLPVQDLIFVCNATYPVEWTFSTQLGGEWSIREYRDRRMVTETTSIPIYSAEFTVTSPTKAMELTCRSVVEKACLQTTVHAKNNKVAGNQTMSIKIVRNHPKGILIQQFTKPEGSNINCAIQLNYDEQHNRFTCHSKTERNLTLNLAENAQAMNCYDPFSCGFFYTEKKCSEETLEGMGSLEGQETFSIDSLESKLPGVIICKPEGRPDTFSAAIHYFYSLPKLCEPEDDSQESPYTPHLHVTLAGVKKGEFLSICPLKEPVYKMDFIIVYCISSLYYFADGIQLIVKSENITQRILAPVQLQVFKENGYRNYTFDVHINDTQITALECSAPVRKSNEWFQQQIPIHILNSSPISFEGGQGVRSIKYTPDTVIRCTATGNPKPKFIWTKDDKKLSGDLKVKENLEEGWTEITIPNENSSAYYGVYSCRVENRIEFKVKQFILGLESSGETELSLWYVWGVILPIAVLVVGALVGFLIWKIVQQTKKLRLLTKAELDEFMLGRPEVLNSQRSSTDYDVNSYAACLPYNKNYEVLKEQLEIDVNAVLGSGAYGMVLRGLFTLRNGEKIRVAIKTVKPMDDISYFKALMGELKIMGFIGKHDNIVNLLGAYTKNLQNREIFIAIEYCDNGCLLNYLRDHRHGFVNFVQNGELQPKIDRISYSQPNQAISTLTLLRWGLQIANGMDFLYHKKVIHGDLAARNVLLSVNLTAKIGDFGLSRQLFEYANYIKKHQSPLPWKWLALECLQDMKFSSKSDVWAYGVTLWELFSLGQVPYAGMSYNDEFMDSLIEGKRPSRPQYVTTELYNLMYACWNIEPVGRPSFLQIKQNFDVTIRKLLPEEYVDLEGTLQLPVINYMDRGGGPNDFGPGSSSTELTNSLRNSVVFYKA